MGNGTEYIIVMVSVPSDGTGEKMACSLVEGKLAACVARSPIKSTYIWDGKIQNDDEELLIIKTRKDAFDALKTKVLEMHVYKVPEIISIPIIDGHTPYLDWISGWVKAEGDTDGE